MQRPTCIAIACALAACGRVDFTATDAHGGAADANVYSRCTGSLHFDDEFDVAGAGPTFVRTSSASEIAVSEMLGELLFDFTGPITTSTYPAYLTTTTYPLAGLCVLVEVSRLVGCAPCGTYMKIFDTNSAAEHYTYTADGGATFRVAMRTHIDATGGSGTVVPYHELSIDDVESASFWQIRQVDNRTYWETSVDGVSFVRHAMSTNLFTDTAVFIAIGAGTTTPISNGGLAGFRRVSAYGL